MSEALPVFDNPTIESHRRLPQDLPIMALPEYATNSIESGFDWPLIMRQLYEQGRADSQTEVYLVVFRSRLLAGADIHKLLKDDEAAHFEASQAPGYITYFKGAADTDGNNLSFCLWQSQNSAREAAFGEKHKLAAGNVSEAYAYFSLQRYFVSQAQDGDVVFIPA